ncbi:MAG: ATP-binding protein [Pseudomonadota bacterium]|nr:ATP-binding protein [Pseudomonadota bacterium]
MPPPETNGEDLDKKTANAGDPSAQLTAELHELREQVREARTALAQLREAAIAIESQSNGRHAIELVAANEQLVVAALYSETRFRSYFDVSPEFLYLLRLTANDEFIVEDVNPAGAGLYGMSREQIIGRTPAELDPADGGTSIDSNARMALRSGKAVTYELTQTFGPRSHTTINIIVAPVGPSGDGNRVLVCGRDLTVQRQAEDALRQSQKVEAIGQLTGGIAHDFNNLLAAIMGALELMKNRIAKGRPAELDRYVTAAQGAATRAASLTHRLLAFARRQTLSPTPTDVNRLIKDIEDLVRRTVGPSVGLEIAATKGLWMTQVDQNQLENALLNLCINSRDAMPDGGRLTVETANFEVDERMAREGDLLAGQYVALSVTDTGTGMTREVISRAFDPFFTTKPLGLGTGLGLSMIYGFARQSGGHVRIYSEVGRGATVCLYLPRLIANRERIDSPAKVATMARAAPGQTVLIVDDEETLRMLVVEVLTDLGYTCLEAGDGASGLEFLRLDTRIDLLISDVGLPGGMNGLQLADAACMLRPGLKVLFITGYAANAVVNPEHFETGMQIMTKPFPMEALGTKIRDMIGNDLLRAG